MEAVDSVALAGSQAMHDLSIVGMFMMADAVVKTVMIILMIASVWCWTIIINKYLLFRKVKARTAQFEDAYYAAQSLDHLYGKVGGNPKDPQAAMFCAAMKELQQGGARTTGIASGVEQRVDRSLRSTMTREMENLEKSLPFLATVGSTAPFMGLFGTVWGIMNSFTAIAATKNTSLAVVAPGIAEALLVTAMGLLAAIPAVMAYNKFTNDISRYAGRLEAFADEFQTLVSRQMESKAA